MPKKEIKDKYPIGSRFLGTDGSVYMVVTYCRDTVYLIKYLANPAIEYYGMTIEDLKNIFQEWMKE